MNKKKKLKWLFNELDWWISHIETQCGIDREYVGYFEKIRNVASNIKNVVADVVEYEGNNDNRYVVYDQYGSYLQLYLRPRRVHNNMLYTIKRHGVSLDDLVSIITGGTKAQYYDATFDEKTAFKLRDTGLFKIEKVVYYG